jgi:hypothetical protein
MRRAAANTLNKQPRTNNKGWYSSYETISRASGLEGYFEYTTQAMGYGYEIQNLKCMDYV